jgi:glycosyltransferase involved in cell wall biosynthesis
MFMISPIDMPKNEKLFKKRIAFLGKATHTLPSYRALLEGLSEFYEITVYSEVYLNVAPAKYKVRSVPNTKFSKRFKKFLFAWIIARDHFINPFHIIHTHSTFPSGFIGVIISKILRTRVVVSLDGAEATALPKINFGDLMGSKRKFINRWVINQADEVIVLTGFLLQEVRNNLKITRAIHVIPRGVSTLKFKYSGKKILTPLKILNVSYLNPVKDQNTLLKAFLLINSKVDSVLIHVGEDFHNGEIQQKVKEMGIADKVFFTGFIANDNLPPYYDQADILLHTSLYESQGIVVNEAMACGLIVCGTHVGLMADLSETCCLTVNIGDAEALAQTVLRLIDNPEQITRLRKNAYEWTLKHDLEWTIQQHISVYENLGKLL